MTQILDFSGLKLRTQIVSVFPSKIHKRPQISQNWFYSIIGPYRAKKSSSNISKMMPFYPKIFLLLQDIFN